MYLNMANKTYEHKKFLLKDTLDTTDTQNLHL